MSQIIHERVSVVTIYNKDGNVLPWKVKWNDRIYSTTKIGLHYPLKEGQKLFHVFGVLTDNNTSLKLSLDTETLQWMLEEVVDESTS